MFAEHQISVILRNAREIEDGLKPLERIQLDVIDLRRLELRKASNALHEALAAIDRINERFNEPLQFLDAAE